MKKLLPLFFLASVLPAYAQNKITAQIIITNATANGLTFTVNGDTRTFTNNVVHSGTQVLTNADVTGCGSKTNLLFQIYGTPFSQVRTEDRGSNSFNLVGNSGLAMSVNVSGTYATVSYSTQQVFSLTALAVPVAGLPTATARTNAASAIVAGINQVENTNQIDQTSVAATQLMGLTKSQTVAGANSFQNPLSTFNGTISNSPSLSGNIAWMKGGVISNVTLVWVSGGVTNGVILTNGTALFAGGIGLPSATSDIWTIGDLFGSGGWQLAVNAHGSGAHFNVFDIQTNSVVIVPPITASSLALISTLDVSGNTTITGDESVGGNLSISGNTTNAGNFAIGGNVAISGTQTNALVTGQVTLTGADIAFSRKTISSLANGNNAAVAPGTNVFCEVSGPTGSFAINGLANGRDGKMLILCNQTGQTMTLANASGVDPTPANRILTGSGGDLAVTTNPGMCALIYSASASRWMVVSHN